MLIQRKKCDIFIIGCGVAGLSAALGAIEGGCWSVIAADCSSDTGGILNRCAHRGFGEFLTGKEYAERLLQRLPGSAPEFLLRTTVISVTKDRVATAVSPIGVIEIEFRELIAALGSREVSPGALKLYGQHPKQIVTAGEIQEQLNLFGKVPEGRSVIVGAGDLGVIVARQLFDMDHAPICIIEKGTHSPAMAKNFRHCIKETGISIRYRSTVCKAVGYPDLESVVIRNDDGKEDSISCELLITAAGLVPERGLISHLLNEDWVHLCGNCEKIYDIADTVVRESYPVGRHCAERIQHD